MSKWRLNKACPSCGHTVAGHKIVTTDPDRLETSTLVFSACLVCGDSCMVGQKENIIRTSEAQPDNPRRDMVRTRLSRRRRVYDVGRQSERQVNANIQMQNSPVQAREEANYQAAFEAVEQVLGTGPSGRLPNLEFVNREFDNPEPDSCNCPLCVAHREAGNDDQ